MISTTIPGFMNSAVEGSLEILNASEFQVNSGNVLNGWYQSSVQITKDSHIKN